MPKIDPMQMLERAPENWETIEKIDEQRAARILEADELVKTRMIPTTSGDALFQWKRAKQPKNKSGN